MKAMIIPAELYENQEILIVPYHFMKCVLKKEANIRNKPSCNSSSNEFLGSTT